MSNKLNTFEFSDENKIKISNILAKYPEEHKKSAVMALLDLAQRQNNNYLSPECIETVAKIIGRHPTEVYEIATFYTMYNLKPVGKYHIQLCGTTPCMLRGSDDLKTAIFEETGIKVGETTSDNSFTLTEVECLGACSNAPMLQINDWYYEDLTPESVKQLIKDLKNGKEIKKGSQINRKSAEPL